MPKEMVKVLDKYLLYHFWVGDVNSRIGQDIGPPDLAILLKALLIQACQVVLVHHERAAPKAECWRDHWEATVLQGSIVPTKEQD